jgi:hypothetical protein
MGMTFRLSHQGKDAHEDVCEEYLDPREKARQEDVENLK